jgi:hypothetical protein
MYKEIENISSETNAVIKFPDFAKNIIPITARSISEKYSDLFSWSGCGYRAAPRTANVAMSKKIILNPWPNLSWIKDLLNMSDCRPFSIVGALPHNANEKKSEMAMPIRVALDRYSLVLNFFFRPINRRKSAVDNNVSSGLRAVQSISS